MPAGTGVLRGAVGANRQKTHSHIAGAMVSQVLGRVNDSDLIRAAQRGDRVAFETLVRQYDQAVLRLATPRTSTRKPSLKRIATLATFGLSARSTPGFTGSLPICAWTICASARPVKKMPRSPSTPAGKRLTCWTGYPMTARCRIPSGI